MKWARQRTRYPVKLLPDIVDPQTRSRMMAGIRGKDTKPEVLVRKALHARGFRFRVHPRNIPGKPDVALPRYSAVILVHGCFWHGHGCHLFKMPGTRQEFWETKIRRNQERDAEVREQLAGAGWRRLVIWECSLKGRTRLDFGELVDRICDWIRSDQSELEIAGKEAA